VLGIRKRKRYDFATQDTSQPSSLREADSMIKMLTKDGPVTKIRARFDTPMQDMVKPNTHEVGDHMITIHTIYGPIPKL
jgi:hypothetical protein